MSIKRSKQEWGRILILPLFASVAGTSILPGCSDPQSNHFLARTSQARIQDNKSTDSVPARESEHAPAPPDLPNLPNLPDTLEWASQDSWLSPFARIFVLNEERKMNSCVGFLIDKAQLVTAAHCFPGPLPECGASVLVHWIGIESDGTPRISKTSSTCVRVERTNGDADSLNHDVALVTISDRPEGIPTIKLSANQSVAYGSPVWSVGPLRQGTEKDVSPLVSRIGYINGLKPKVTSNMTAVGGHSGSPVFQTKVTPLRTPSREEMQAAVSNETPVGMHVGQSGTSHALSVSDLLDAITILRTASGQ